MTHPLRSTRSRHARGSGRAALLALAIAVSFTTVEAGDRSSEVRSTCGDPAANTIRFEPILHKIATSAPLGQGDADVRWALSSEVTGVGNSAPATARYCYAYVFSNLGSTPVKISLVSHRIALSPLFEAMQDFSLELDPGAIEVIRFTTGSAPELALATAYNSARDEQIAKWALVSSGPVSLYLPAGIQAASTVLE